MKRALRLFLLSISIIVTLPGYAQGLKFTGMEGRIEERTSLDLFGGNPRSFQGYLDLAFEFSALRQSDFGYIVRVKERGGNSRVWNVSYDSKTADTVVVRVNEEGQYSLIKARIPHRDINEQLWTDFHFRLDSGKDSVLLDIGGRHFSSPAGGLERNADYSIALGRNEHIIDVPSFAIRNLRVCGEGRQMLIPFDEYSGKKVHDASGRPVATVENPSWMIHESISWSQLCSRTSESVAGSCYNAGQKEFYYFNAAGIWTYNILRGEFVWSKYANRCPVVLRSCSCFLQDGKLVVYEPCNDLGPDGECDAAVAALDLETLEWTPLSRSRLQHPVFHHCGLQSPADGRYCIFGGYGDFLYNGDIYVLDGLYNWQPLGDVTGAETLYPRYFTSAGCDEDGRYAYIFGGMGNKGGEQVVGRRYFYDLHRIDLTTGECTLLWDLDWKEDNIVPVRNLIVAGDCFYTLCYPEYQSNSSLKLYRFSLSDGGHEILGDEIGIVSDRLLTNANIYYDSSLNKLLATTMVFDDDIKSELNIYTIAFPPLDSGAAGRFRLRQIFAWQNVLLVLALLLCAGLAAVQVRKRKKRRESGNPSSTAAREKVFNAPDKPLSINTFGTFQIRGSDGRDISGRFSAQQTTILLLLLKYYDTGVSSQKLGYLLWPDKEEDKVKNSRGTAIKKLRDNLALTGAMGISYSGKTYRLTLDEPAWCDVVFVRQELSKDNPDEDAVLQALSAGKFLMGNSDPLFDSFKDKVEQKVIAFLDGIIEKYFNAGKYPEVLEIADMIYNIDPLSETALSFQLKSFVKLRRKEDALKRYAAFASTFASTNGAKFSVTFEKLL